MKLAPLVNGFEPDSGVHFVEFTIEKLGGYRQYVQVGACQAGIDPEGMRGTGIWIYNSANGFVNAAGSRWEGGGCDAKSVKQQDRFIVEIDTVKGELHFVRAQACGAFTESGE